MRSCRAGCITAAVLAVLVSRDSDRRSEGAGGSGADTLVDAAGRTVRLPTSAERAVSPFTMYTRLIVAPGGCDKLAGISQTCVLS